MHGDSLNLIILKNPLRINWAKEDCKRDYRNCETVLSKKNNRFFDQVTNMLSARKDVVIKFRVCVAKFLL